jgi:hypothetical protein
MAAEFTDNLIAYLEDKAKEFNPNFSTAEGTAIRDLFVKPFSVIFQPIVDEILKVRANLSLADAASLSDTDLELLAANFFITRKAGAAATGNVRIFFNEPVDEFVAQNTVFIGATGVRFLASEDTQVTTSGLRLNTFGDLFFIDTLVVAETAGISGNIAADLITDILISNDKIVDVTNPSAFAGGTDTETNSELLDRLAIAITFRNLINDNGAKLILLENFARLLDVLVVGFNKTHKVKDEFLGVGDGIDTAFQLSETEDVITTSLGVKLETADELVLVGPGVLAGFKQLDFFPYDAASLALKIGPSFLAGTSIIAGTDFVGGPQISLADELLVTAPLVATPYPTDFFPVDASPAIQVRYGATFLTGLPLTVAHYTINLVTGDVTFTPAGVALILASQVHVKYNATSTLSGAFALTEAGAFKVNNPGTLVPPQVFDHLRAEYTADPLDSSVASVDFFGVVTFAFPPSTGAQIYADFEYYLMRRDRMSGTGLVLGDDTFGTVTNAHIGGKVDYYLKFLGMEATEVRMNGVKAENFLFVQGPADPAPTVTQQYISGMVLPIVPRVADTGPLLTTSAIAVIETVDIGTNLPSGIFLTQVAGVPVGPNEFRLTILPNKLNVNLSSRQKLNLEVSPDVVAQDVFFRYFTHQDFGAVQAFIDDPVNRIVTADLLARAPMPVFVDITINHARVGSGPDSATVQAAVIDYINSLKLDKCLTIYNLTKALRDAGVEFVVLPIVLYALRVNLDFSKILITSDNKIEVPPNFQFIARLITVNEVEFEDCDTI